MAAPRNRGLWANGKPIAPGSRIPVSRESLAGQQAGEAISSMGEAIAARVHQVFGKPEEKARPMLKVRPTLQVKKED